MILLCRLVTSDGLVCGLDACLLVLSVQFDPTSVCAIEYQ